MTWIHPMAQPTDICAFNDWPSSGDGYLTVRKNTWITDPNLRRIPGAAAGQPVICMNKYFGTIKGKLPNYI